MSEGLEKIVLCFDNSENSVKASNASIGIARLFGSTVVGVHGYNAVMHESAFRIMEPTLPAQYQHEDILHKQRSSHDVLIKVGMEKISLSYLKPVEEEFGNAGIPFKAVVKEGKNYVAINRVIEDEAGGLVVIGASGFNTNMPGFLGSVCLRVLRNTTRDILIVKDSLNLVQPDIVVCLDGSSTAYGALMKAKKFAEKTNGRLHLVYVFDSNIHTELFGKLKESVINCDNFNFNTSEQEKFHDEFIDKGLARVGHMILDKAEREAFNVNPMSTPLTDGWGLVGDAPSKPCIKKVFAGHIYKKICEYVEKVKASFVFVGRIGRHHSEFSDIGSVTENIARYAPAGVYVSKKEEETGWKL